MNDYNFYKGRCIQSWKYLNVTFPCAICGEKKNTGYNGPYFGIIIQKGDLGNKSAEWRHVCSMEHGQNFIDNVLPKRNNHKEIV
jgi:hypothetical protein